MCKKVQSHFEKYIVSESSTIKDVLGVIDRNTEGFCLVVQNDKLVATLSDGDVRRLVLSGLTLNDKILSIINSVSPIELGVNILRFGSVFIIDKSSEVLCEIP